MAQQMGGTAIPAHIPGDLVVDFDLHNLPLTNAKDPRAAFMAFREGLDCQYQFSQELEAGWTWSERYSEGPVIQKYLAYVADRLDLRRDITLNTRVESATFDEAANVWQICKRRPKRWTPDRA